VSLTVALRLLFQGKEAQAGVRSTATEVKGLTTATREAGAASATAAGQQRQLAGALTETEAAARSTAAAQIAAAQTGRDMAQSNRLAAGSVGTLTANFNDVGMMIAAGQNPLTVAIQQGTQITQVIGPMGAAGAVGALKTAFLQMVTPLNLVTLGVIAFGAAAVQWLTGASEDVKSFEDSLESLQNSVESYDKAATKASSTTADLRKEFGGAAEAARQYYRDLAEIEKREAIRATQEAMASLKQSLGADQQGLAEAFGINFRSLTGGRAVNEVIGALVEVEGANGLNAQIAALERLKAALEAAAAADGARSVAEDAGLRQVNQLLIEQAALRERIAQANGEGTGGQLVDLAALVQMQNDLAAARAEDAALGQQMLADLTTEAQIRQLITQYGSDSAVVAAARANAERDAYAAMVDSLNVSAALKAELIRAYDAAKGIASVNMAGVIEAAVSRAAALANNLWNAARASSAIRPFANLASNAASGVKGWASGVWTNMVTMASSGTGAGSGAGVGSGAGGGGGASAAKAEADAVAELIERQERELELLRETDPVKKEMLRYREQLAGATDAERQKIEELIATRLREEQQIKAYADAVGYANDMTLNFLNTVIVQGKSANAVLQQLLGSLLQAFTTGKGPLAGILGISGGIWDAILPKNAPAMALAGAFPGALPPSANKIAPAPPGSRGPDRQVVINVNVSGASGDAHIRSLVSQGVQAGLRMYDSDAAPKSIRLALSDPQVTRR
jgi:hypothetical protein